MLVLGKGHHLPPIAAIFNLETKMVKTAVKLNVHTARRYENICRFHGHDLWRQIRQVIPVENNLVRRGLNHVHGRPKNRFVIVGLHKFVKVPASTHRLRTTEKNKNNCATNKEKQSRQKKDPDDAFHNLVSLDGQDISQPNFIFPGNACRLLCR